MICFCIYFYVYSIKPYQKINISYYTPTETSISKNDATKYANIIMKFTAFSQTFNIILSDNTITTKIHIKHNQCIYSARIFGKQSYGYYNLCTETGEIRDDNFTYNIADGNIDRTYQRNSVMDPEPDIIKKGEKHMKIMIVNTYELYDVYPDNVRSYEIFNKAKEILESVDYEGHNLKFVLAGVYNIAEEDVLGKDMQESMHRSAMDEETRKKMVDSMKASAKQTDIKSKERKPTKEIVEESVREGKQKIIAENKSKPMDDSKQVSMAKSNTNAEEEINDSVMSKDTTNTRMERSGDNAADTEEGEQVQSGNTNQNKQKNNGIVRYKNPKEGKLNSKHIKNLDKDALKSTGLVSENHSGKNNNEQLKSNCPKPLKIAESTKPAQLRKTDVLETRVKQEIITNLNDDLSFVTKFLKELDEDAKDEVEIAQDNILEGASKRHILYYNNRMLQEYTNKFDTRKRETSDRTVREVTNMYDLNTQQDKNYSKAKNIEEYKNYSKAKSIEESKNYSKAKSIEESNAAETLQKYADFFIKLQSDNTAASQANLIIFYTLKTDLSYIEGLTYKSGACSKNDRFSLIHISPKDSVFYQAKVTAHEILHSLGASHGCKYLMDSQGCTTCREDDTKISACTVAEVSNYIDDHDPVCFNEMNLCGNGQVDPGEECDSGMPFGSLCCTSTCKLRKDAECDDNNGKCCRDCKFLEVNTICNGIGTENECANTGYCTGKSAFCNITYKPNQSVCTDGFCLNGTCQTKKLMCERVGKQFSAGCDEANSCQLVCSSNEMCALIASVYDNVSEIINLPDMMPCMIGNRSGMCMKGQCQLDGYTKGGYSKYGYSKYRDALFLVFVLVIIVSLMLYIL